MGLVRAGPGTSVVLGTGTAVRLTQNSASPRGIFPTCSHRCLPPPPAVPDVQLSRPRGADADASSPGRACWSRSGRSARSGSCSAPPSRVREYGTRTSSPRRTRRRRSIRRCSSSAGGSPSTTSCRSASRCGARCRPRSPARARRCRRARRAACCRSGTSFPRCCGATASSRARRSSARCTSCSRRSAAARRSSTCTSSSPSRRRCCAGSSRAGSPRSSRRPCRATRSCSRRRRAADTHVPTEPQRRAIDRLARAGPDTSRCCTASPAAARRSCTSSCCAASCSSEGKTAIVLVPEIALTPQTVDRFRAVFGDQIAVLHSALSDGERYDAWLALRRGEKRIAVGARSAIFAPLRDLGAIVVDEEHESSYKQGEAPRYHAREVAIVRARAEGAVVVLGSATPSLESWTNAQSGQVRAAHAPGARRRRAAAQGRGRRPAHRAREVAAERDARCGRRVRDGGEPAAGRGAARRVWRAGEQSILLLNRRGYAAFVQCGACGDVATCPNCSITLTYHRTPERLVCHYCQHAEALRSVCPRCGGARLRQRGLGTQQVERMLAERFPDGAHRAHGRRHDEREVGARRDPRSRRPRRGRHPARHADDREGARLPERDAGRRDRRRRRDQPSGLPRVERTFQLLSQVAGRAGRGPKGGEVLIQTRAPSHHAVRCAVTHDYRAFVRRGAEGPHASRLSADAAARERRGERSRRRRRTARLATKPPRGCTVSSRRAGSTA